MVKLLYVHKQPGTQQKKGTDSKTWADSKQSLLREKGSDSDQRTIPISSHHMILAGKVNLGFFFKEKQYLHIPKRKMRASTSRKLGQTFLSLLLAEHHYEAWVLLCRENTKGAGRRREDRLTSNLGTKGICGREFSLFCCLIYHRHRAEKM